MCFVSNRQSCYWAWIRTVWILSFSHESDTGIWIDWICNQCSLSFSIVKNHLFQKQSKFQPIHSSSLMKCMTKLTLSVKSKILRILPQNFVLLFDEKTEGNAHLVVLFASLSTSNLWGCKTSLFGFSPFENEKSQNADQYISYSAHVLELFWKSLYNVIALCRDNRPTNQSFSNIVGKPLVVCASYRYNLAVRYEISPYRTIVSK